MNTQTQTRIDTSTQTKITLAVVAMAVAGGLAFGFLPVRNKYLATKQTVQACSVSNMNYIGKCSTGKYKSIDVTCSNGLKKEISNSGCVSTKELQKLANSFCAAECKAVAPTVQKKQEKSIANAPVQKSSDVVTLYGCGEPPAGWRDNTEYRLAPNFHLQGLSDNASVCFSPTANNIVLDGNNLDLVAPENAREARVIELANANVGVTIKNFDFHQFTGYPISLKRNSTGAQIFDNSFVGIPRAIELEGSTVNTIRDNSFDGVRNFTPNSYAIRLADASSNVVKNNEFENYRTALLAENAHSISIEDNVFNELAFGVTLNNVANAVIKENTFTRNLGNPISLQGDVHGAQIDTNRLVNNGGGSIDILGDSFSSAFKAAIFVLGENSTAFSREPIEIKNNFLDRNEDNGIFLREANHTIVENNVIRQTGEQGIRIDESHDLVIANNEVTLGWNTGVYFENIVTGTRSYENIEFNNNRICHNANSDIYCRSITRQSTEGLRNDDNIADTGTFLCDEAIAFTGGECGPHPGF